VPVVGDSLVKLTPEKPGYVFTPASLTFHSQNGNQLVNFSAAGTGLPISVPAILKSAKLHRRRR